MLFYPAKFTSYPVESTSTCRSLREHKQPRLNPRNSVMTRTPLTICLSAAPVKAYLRRCNCFKSKGRQIGLSASKVISVQAGVPLRDDPH